MQNVIINSNYDFYFYLKGYSWVPKDDKWEDKELLESQIGALFDPITDNLASNI